jgi:hypothetical protein
MDGLAEVYAALADAAAWRRINTARPPEDDGDD